MPFPIRENITEFLLSIPSVTAVCNEKGTRIFNILPSEKVKHIHRLVVDQKLNPNIQQRLSIESGIETSYRSRNWRNNLNYRKHQLDGIRYENDFHGNDYMDYLEYNGQDNIFEELDVDSNNNNNIIQIDRNQVTTSSSQNHSEIEDDIDLPLASSETKQQCETEGKQSPLLLGNDASKRFISANWIYEDNCNYL